MPRSTILSAISCEDIPIKKSIFAQPACPTFDTATETQAEKLPNLTIY